MNYILYNPRSNSEHNDLNIIPGKEELERRGVRQISLIELDTREFFKTLTESDRVLICGGDGTLHHFINNIRGLDMPCPIYVIRSGTGNDFLNDIGQIGTEELTDIRKYIRSLPEVEIDGEKRVFINGVGIGIDGAVCDRVEKYKKSTGKKANYTAIALKELAYRYKCPNATVTIDGVTHHFKDVWMASAMQGKFFGGGMMIAPTQNRESGKLSVMVMHGGSRPKILTVFPSVFKGKHLKYKDIIEVFECDEVTVRFEIPTAFQADGETRSEMTTYTARSASLLESMKNADNCHFAEV